MKNSMTKKISLYKKLLVCMNLDIQTQIFLLLKFFIPMLIIGGIIQLLLPRYGHDINIVSFVTCIFVMLIFAISLPPRKIEIISRKDQYIRLIKMLCNIFFGLMYFGIAIFSAARLLYYIEKLFSIKDDALFCIRCIYGVVCFVTFLWLILWKYRKNLFFKLPDIITKNVHILYIENNDFAAIETKQKNVEFRLADNKRKKIKIGDVLIFSNIDNLEKCVYTEVTKLYFAPDFKNLIAKTGIHKTGYTNAGDMLDFWDDIYTIKQQKKYGVIGIEFELNK